jgi:hypothetical protein
MGIQPLGSLRRLCLACGLAAGLTIVAGTPSGAGQPPQDAPTQQPPPSSTAAFKATVDYVVEFYPLWFTFRQAHNVNQLIGPDRISPLYHAVVAINVDTLYASAFVDLKAQPVILTIPSTKVTYSLLILDPFGDIIDLSNYIPPQTAGTYALVGPGFKGSLPQGVTRVPMPLNVETVIFRADKFSATGQGEIKEADQFRRSLRLETLSDYKNDPSGGKTRIAPEIIFSVPYKTIADTLITRDPIRFLKQLQTAVASSNTPPLTPYERALSDRFNSLFHNGNISPKQRFLFQEGARAAHRLILERYLTHTGPTNWIHFTNIGDWGKNVIERSSITEFIQYGNGISTAAYYHAFEDAQGRPLDGTDPRGYVLTFSKEQIPQAKRFWSLTAYTPEAVELVSNPAGKYVVARYTPGLQYNPDGSLSVYLARTLPAGVPQANWLPIPRGPFNVMLRVYGPEGNDSHNTYAPPGIQKRD